ncbi:uncharacterized protein LOC118816712 [Colossoma macropomum]|uniref:uncharacterized protein LOC118816712 n=1 Tax=Colossoma macropomum TaxID=42526 RepID=UPI00186553EA|nr:uncharacterized protein LOC118816712 [Colossoma macropomum]XP_036439145.1 uncharacterized protein LOC118816712 [Colossoma macropomum]
MTRLTLYYLIITACGLYVIEGFHTPIYQGNPVRGGPRKIVKTLTMEYQEGVTGTVKFDLCQIIKCTDQRTGYIWAEKYVCEMPLIDTPGLTKGSWCDYWNDVICNSGISRWGYSPARASHGPDPLNQRMSICQGQTPTTCSIDDCNPMYLTLTRPKPSDAGLYVLGVIFSGQDPLGHFQIKVTPKPYSQTTSNITSNTPMQDNATSGSWLNSTRFSMSKKLAIETGYAARNEWFEWMLYTAKTTNVSNCVACSASRPQLGTTPFRLTQINADEGLRCTLRLFTRDKFLNCTCQLFSYLFPATKPTMPPGVLALPGNYTCFSRSSGQKNGSTLPWCTYSYDVTKNGNGYPSKWFTDHTMADLWWLCGDRKLRAVLPQSWQGSCALVQLLMPFHIYPTTAFSALPEKLKRHHRQKRDTPAPGAFDSHIYTDAIGVPRGVPDEFKARNQIAAGFEAND